MRFILAHPRVRGLIFLVPGFRKVYRNKKRYEAPANQELVALLAALAENNEDTSAPAVVRAADELEHGLQTAVRIIFPTQNIFIILTLNAPSTFLSLSTQSRGKQKSYTLYQLSRYVKRH